MESAPIAIEIENHVATLTIDRPPVNAVNTATMLAMADAFRSLYERRDVRVAIFTGAGTKAFIGGADLDAIRSADDETPPTLLTDPGVAARKAMWSITDCPVPVIGAINGPAPGAGLAFAACCDMMIAAEHAWFGTLEINVGLLGAGSHLMQMVGRHKAREMFFLGEKVPAEELQRLGVIRKVVSSDALMTTARELAAELAKKSPIALRLAKESMNRIEGLPLKDAYRTEQDYTTRLLGFEDSREARAAFREKREPDWNWR
jgi:enoyl-CoA hydratase